MKTFDNVENTSNVQTLITENTLTIIVLRNPTKE
jgi:hypothetical protein